MLRLKILLDSLSVLASDRQSIFILCAFISEAYHPKSRRYINRDKSCCKYDNVKIEGLAYEGQFTLVIK